MTIATIAIVAVDCFHDLIRVKSYSTLALLSTRMHSNRFTDCGTDEALTTPQHLPRLHKRQHAPRESATPRHSSVSMGVLLKILAFIIALPAVVFLTLQLLIKFERYLALRAVDAAYQRRRALHEAEMEEKRALARKGVFPPRPQVILIRKST